MKVLKSLVDEVLEYIQMGTYEISSGLGSLLFWRGQVKVFGNIHLPLHSLVAFCSAVYVIDHPHSVPSFIFFSIAYYMLVQMNHRKNDPSPWYRCKTFNKWFPTAFLPFYNNSDGININAGDGIRERLEIEKEKLRRIEEDKLLQEKIAAVRSELQQILSSLGDFSLHTSDDGVSLNPLKRLLPIQLILKGKCDQLCIPIDIPS